MSALVFELLLALGLGALTVGLVRRSAALGAGVVVASLVAASSSIADVKDVFLTARWGALGGLALALVPPAARRLPRDRALVLFVVAPAVAAASAAWSVDPRLTLLRAVTFATLVSVAVALALRGRRDEAERGRLLDALAVTGAAAAGLSFLLWALEPETAIFVGDLRGVLENPNGLGLLLGLTYVCSFAAVERRSPPRLALALLVAPVAAVVALAGSRSGLLALAVAIAVYELARRSYGRLAVQLAVALTAYAVVATTVSDLTPAPSAPEPPAVTDTTGGAPSTGTGGAPAGGGGPPPAVGAEPDPGVGPAAGQPVASWLLGARDEGWRAAAELISSRPVVGYGFGTGDRLFDRYPEVAHFTFFQGDNPNNGYLHVALELGTLAVVLVAPLLLAAWVAAARVRRGRSDPAAAAFAALLAGGLAAALVESLFTAAGAPWAALIWIAAAEVLLGASARAPAAAPLSSRTRTASPQRPRPAGLTR